MTNENLSNPFEPSNIIRSQKDNLKDFYTQN